MDLAEKLELLWEKHGITSRLNSSLFDAREAFRLIRESPLEALSSERLESSPVKYHWQRILAHLPIDVVLNEFGEDVAVWQLLDGSFGERKETYYQLTQKNRKIFRQSEFSNMYLASSPSAKTLLRTYDFLVKMHNQQFAIDLAPLLRKYAGEGIVLSENRVKDYSLASLSVEGEREIGYDIHFGRVEKEATTVYGIYLDAPFGIALCYKGKPNGVVTFSPTTAKTLMIFQLQGVGFRTKSERGVEVARTHARGLIPLQWEKVLVGCAEEIARQHGFTWLAVQGGRNNVYTSIPKFANSNAYPKLPPEKALKRYDTTAEELGFFLREDKNWYKCLK
ncbi:hypothetical protein HY501_02875 [Candidatus Woesearchaeota archaeon]|nr:hypothetical protein [Candidatus Woesearchaeota archaeon]